MDKARANEAAITDMNNLLGTVKVLRDRLNLDQTDEAKRLVGEIGVRLANLINECRE